MTTLNTRVATPRFAPLGLFYLLVTSVGWGLNWPMMKIVLREWPPLSARGLSGLAGALLLAGYVLIAGQSLRVARDQWPRLLVSAFLNVTLWMAVMGIALVYLPASEAAVIAYTMPVWTAVLAWPLLGERLTSTRVVALLMAFAGLAVLFGGNGVSASMAKLPGIVLALIGSFGFALGTIWVKRFPIALPPATSVAWQVGIGCLPVALAGLLFEHASFAALSTTGWLAMAYMTTIQFCVAYVAWFAALARLPASFAAIGTMLVPVIGVVASATALHEPLGPTKIAALVFTIVSVALAARA